MTNELNIVINQDVIDSYAKYYFEKHPRAYKKPIEDPRHPSINKWMILQRQSMNALKQKWKDFIVWYVMKLGYNTLHIDKCEIEICTTLPTKIRSDIDNYCPKFILDGFVDGGLIVDDSYFCIDKLTMSCRYEKGVKRTDITIRY